MKLVLSLNSQTIAEIDLETSREYIVGRAETNDIPLQKYPGISRKHLRIYFNGTKWCAEVLSKMESFFVNGQPATELDLVDKGQLTLGPYVFAFSEEIVQQEAQAVGQAVVTEPLPSAPVSTDEHTQIAGRVGIPFVRIYSEILRIDKMLRLEGSVWIAGRDKTCAIVLDDPHCSRRHFEITQTSKGFYVTDLESANGTAINGSKLRANEPSRIGSGDVITVSQTQLHFEIRDPEFQRKLELVPQDLLAQKSIEIKEEKLEVPEILEVPAINSTAQFSAQYAKELAAYSAYYKEYMNAAQTETSEKSPPNKRLIIIRGLILFLIVTGAVAAYFMKSGDNKQKPIEGKASDPFNLLPPDQQALVKDSYQLAKSLTTHRKYVMAQDELTKVHQILPSGYHDSKQLLAEAQRAIQVRRDAEEIERLKKEKEEMAAKVAEVLAKCKSSIQPDTTAEEITTCLQPVIEMDPENTELKSLLALVEAAQQERDRLKKEKGAYQAQVAQLTTLCQKADQITDDEPALKAALKKCSDSKLPDPRHLKDRAKDRLAVLEGEVDKRIAELLASAQQSYQKQDYKAAVHDIKQIKRLRARHQESLALMDKIEADTNNQMKTLYGDSVLEESYGKIELAKEKWLKIIEFGLVDSEYHKRAKRKLERYGVNK